MYWGHIYNAIQNWGSCKIPLNYHDWNHSYRIQALYINYRDSSSLQSTSMQMGPLFSDTQQICSLTTEIFMHWTIDSEVTHMPIITPYLLRLNIKWAYTWTTQLSNLLPKPQGAHKEPPRHSPAPKNPLQFEGVQLTLVGPRYWRRWLGYMMDRLTIWSSKEKTKVASPQRFHAKWPLSVPSFMLIKTISGWHWMLHMTGHPLFGRI